MKVLNTLLILLVLSCASAAQTTLTDIDKIGIRTSAPVAVVDVDGLPTQGGQQVLRMQSNEPGSGNFGISHTSYAGVHGETRRDHVMCWGYNCQGAGYVPGEHDFAQVFESRYKTAGGTLQSEFYFTTGVNGLLTRPFSIDLFHDSGATQVGISTGSFFIADPGQTNLWFRAVSNKTSGDLLLFGNSGIQYSGTREFFISTMGQGALGKSGNTWKLGGGGIEGETLDIFGRSNYWVAPLTIKVGKSGGFRIGGNGHRWQVSGNYTGYSDIQTAFDVNEQNVPSKIVKRGPSGEIDAGRLEVNNVKVVGSRCAAIPNSTGTTADNTRAINAILACMRTHGLIN